MWRDRRPKVSTLHVHICKPIQKIVPVIAIFLLQYRLRLKLTFNPLTWSIDTDKVELKPTLKTLTLTKNKTRSIWLWSELSRLPTAYIRFCQDTILVSPVVRNVGVTFGKYLTWDMSTLVRKNATASSTNCPTASSSDPFRNFLHPWSALVLWHVLFSLSIFGNDW